MEPFVWPYIDGTDDWILAKRKMGLMATDRMGVELDAWYDGNTVASASDGSRITSLIAGTPLETTYNNMVGNNECECFKNCSIG